MFELLAQILVGSSWDWDFQSALFHIQRRNVNQEFVIGIIMMKMMMENAMVMDLVIIVVLL